MLDISAQGLVSLDSGQFVHRFYTDDHVMLQAMSDDEAGLESYDFSLFIPWTSAYPPGERERRIWRDRLSAPVFHGAAEDLPDYPRFWFAESDAIQPPVTLWETIWADRAATTPYAKIFQTCMLYARELGGGRELMIALGAAAGRRRDDARNHDRHSAGNGRVPRLSAQSEGQDRCSTGSYFSRGRSPS